MCLSSVLQCIQATCGPNKLCEGLGRDQHGRAGASVLMLNSSASHSAASHLRHWEQTTLGEPTTMLVVTLLTSLCISPTQPGIERGRSLPSSASHRLLGRTIYRVLLLPMVTSPSETWELHLSHTMGRRSELRL